MITPKRRINVTRFIHQHRSLSISTMTADTFILKNDAAFFRIGGPVEKSNWKHAASFWLHAFAHTLSKPFEVSNKSLHFVIGTIQRFAIETARQAVVYPVHN